MHAGLATFEQALNATIRHGSIATLDDVMYLLVFARDSSAEDACIHGQFSLKSSAPKGMISRLGIRSLGLDLDSRTDAMSAFMAVNGCTLSVRACLLSHPCAQRLTDFLIQLQGRLSVAYSLLEALQRTYGAYAAVVTRTPSLCCSRVGTRRRRQICRPRYVAAQLRDTTVANYKNTIRNSET